MSARLLMACALLAFGALYAGIPFCPVSPAYSLISRDYGKLGYLMKLLTPGLVFADDAGKFADAITANVPPGIEIAARRGEVPGRDEERQRGVEDGLVARLRELPHRAKRYRGVDAGETPARLAM